MSAKKQQNCTSLLNEIRKQSQVKIIKILRLQEKEVRKVAAWRDSFTQNRLRVIQFAQFAEGVLYDSKSPMRIILIMSKERCRSDLTLPSL